MVVRALGAGATIHLLHFLLRRHSLSLQLALHLLQSLVTLEIHPRPAWQPLLSRCLWAVCDFMAGKQSGQKRGRGAGGGGGRLKANIRYVDLLCARYR